ncbi:hypothetical protein PHMEG_00028390 [Phytophthora megakarya]|uniref:Uncharacterized protein n=1 Tax=Phytophthora megakarya TaxID=4795 RepID=A0A225V7K2_9STRA|nr:hypothetical protein PHMEG_00028390 [Phytophthora megakarya]
MGIVRFCNGYTNKNVVSIKGCSWRAPYMLPKTEMWTYLQGCTSILFPSDGQSFRNGASQCVEMVTPQQIGRLLITWIQLLLEDISK